ncbi:MAG: WYL domain-containing protein [Acidimicrobiales bacterium]
MKPPAETGSRLRRLLAMVPWLLAEGGAPVSELAARFAVAEDEVVRDLQLVGLCGVPPYGGGDLVDVWVDDEGFVHAYPGPFFARPMQLTPAEGFAVSAAGRALLAVPGADRHGSLAAALEALDEVLGHGALEVELAASAQLDVVRAATERSERLEVGYYSAWRDEVTERRIDPFLVHATEGHWYVEAHCHRAGDLRRFRVDRIEWARSTGEHFPPRDLPPPAELFAPGPEAATLTLDIAATARWAVEAAPVTHVEERADGRLRVQMAVAGTAFVERLLLRLGADAQVVGPPDMADVGRRAAARLLARYGEDGDNGDG